MKSTAQERRRHQRIGEAVCAWLSFRKDGAAYGSLTMDLGPEGAQFSALRSVDVGEHVMVHLQLPSSDIECKGKVCWVGPAAQGSSSFGVRFMDLREVERERLGRFLQKMPASLSTKQPRILSFH